VTLFWEDPTREGTFLYDGDVLTEDPLNPGEFLIAESVVGITSREAYQSSLWSSSGTHSLRVPIDTPVGKRTNLFTNPSFETASGTVEVRRNLVPNPGFENASALAGWTLTAGVTASTTTVHGGGTSAKMVGASGSVYYLRYNSIPVVAGQTYTASVWVYRESGTSLMRLTVADMTEVATTSVSATNTIGSWQRVTATFTPTTTTAYVRVLTDNVGTTYIDDVLLEKSPTLNTYFDGTTPPKVRRNIYPGTRSKVGTTGTLENNVTVDGLVWDRFTQGDPSGSGQVRYTVNLSDLANGEPYAISAVVRNDSAFEINVHFDWCDGSDYNGTLAPGEERPISFTGARGAYDSTYRFLDFNTSTAGGVILLRDLLIEHGTDVLPFFNGDTSPTQGYLPAWEGTANASPSYLYDGDFTQSWVGTANASESVLTALGVPGGPSGPMPGTRAAFQSSRWSKSGSKSVRIPAYLNNDSFHNVPGAYPTGVDLAGKTFTIMGTVRAESAIQPSGTTSVWRKFRVQYGNGTSSIDIPVTVSGAPGSGAGEWEVRGTFTVPGDAVAMAFVRVYNGDAAGGSDVWWDDLLLVEGDYSGGYFDGDQSALGLYTAWTGVANASTSYEMGAGVDLPSAVTVAVVAGEAGQQVLVDNTLLTSVFAGETLRAEGSTLVTFGTGWWDNLTFVSGAYNGPPIYGPPWTGTADASTSTYTLIGNDQLFKYGASWLIDQDIRLSDSRYGYTLGTVKDASINGGLVSISGESRLAKLGTYGVNAQPFVGTLEAAFTYYLSLAGVTVDLFVDAAVATRNVVLRGFTGDLWHHLKQLAASQECDISLVSGIILLRPIRTRVADAGKFVTNNPQVGSGAFAQSVEVYWYESAEITDELVYPVGGWSPDVEVLNVNAGETAEYQLELSASVSSIEDPVMSTAVESSYDASSVYTIVGDDGFPVPVAQWAANGGSLRVTINPDTTSLTLTLTGATNIGTASGSTSKAFSVALSSDTTGSRYSTLRIVGTGVGYTRSKKVFRTGVPANKTATDVGETIDNVFITDLNELYHVGSRAALRYSGLLPSVTGNVTAINRRGDSGSAEYPTYGAVEAELTTTLGAAFTYADAETYYVTTSSLADYVAVSDFWFATVQSDFANQAFGNVNGARIYDPITKRWYRIRNGSISPTGIGFSAEDDLTFDDVAGTLTGRTYADVELTRTDLTYQQERMVGLIG